MARSKFARLREAAALQRSLREIHGDEAEEVLAEHIAQTSSASLAQATFDAAIARNRRTGVRFQLLGGGLPGKLTGAEVKKGLISGRLQVHVRHGEGPSLRVNRLQRAEEVAALLRHLAAGGAPPR